MDILKVGNKAPDFSLLDQNKNRCSLLDFQGQWVVLFFYPKDNTPGCTIEACHFRDDYKKISLLNTQILGINTDSNHSHTRFINKQQLPFPLLSDETGEVSKRYDALFKLGPLKFSKRHSFIICPQGNIATIYRKVSPSKHSKQIISDLNYLQTETRG